MNESAFVVVMLIVAWLGLIVGVLSAHQRTISGTLLGFGGSVVAVLLIWYG